MRALTGEEQELHHEQAKAVMSALSALRLSGLTDEDITVAKARLENWLTENHERWTR